MTVNVRGKVLPLLAASALALGVAACGGSDPDGNAGTSDLSGELTASGASFPDAYYQVAIEAYAEVAPEVVINYNATGSSTGKKEFGENLVDFAGTDSLVGEDDPLEPGSFYYIPTVAAPITISYNLPEAPDLQLGQEVVAQIFQGDITTPPSQRPTRTWNCPPPRLRSHTAPTVPVRPATSRRSLTRPPSRGTSGPVTSSSGRPVLRARRRTPGSPR